MSQQPASTLSDGANADEAPQMPTGSNVEVFPTPPVGTPPGTTATASPKKWTASVFPGQPVTLPDDLAGVIVGLEQALQMPVWMLLQGSQPMFSEIGDELYQALFERRADFQGKPIALLIDSPGGYAQSAYQIATLLRRHCGGFITLVPRYAKSAATLLALGASEIIISKDAELGPLDAQYHDFERETRCSSLDEVQALERLHAFGLEAFDKSIILLRHRTRKKIETLLPSALSFVADMMRPLLEKIDTVHYSQMSRQLKVAEEYAFRLLRPTYAPDEARRIARHLVHQYPEHEFIIDADEARAVGIKAVDPSTPVAELLDKLHPHLGNLTVVGKLQEVVP